MSLAERFREEGLKEGMEKGMEKGERVIIVTGCINALRSRVSETLTKYISSLLRVIKV